MARTTTSMDFEIPQYPTLSRGDEEPYTISAYGLSTYEELYPRGAMRFVSARPKKPKRRTLIQSWPDANNTKGLAEFARRLSSASQPQPPLPYTGKVATKTGSTDISRPPLATINSNINISSSTCEVALKYVDNKTELPSLPATSSQRRPPRSIRGPRSARDT